MRRSSIWLLASVAAAVAATEPGLAQFQSAPGPEPAVRPAPRPAPYRRPYVEPEEALPQLPPPAIAAPTPPPPAKPFEVTIPYTVNGGQQPWRWNASGLNSGFPYGANDGAPPMSVDSAHFRFRPGDPLTLSYIGGRVKGGLLLPEVDALGDTHDPGNADDRFLCGTMPSRYMSPYPIYVMELVGTFADNSGSIVGRPFAIGNRTVNLTVPVGATQLLLGFNDCLYGDNTGSVMLNIHGLNPAEQGPAPQR